MNFSNGIKNNANLVQQEMIKIKEKQRFKNSKNLFSIEDLNDKENVNEKLFGNTTSSLTKSKNMNFNQDSSKKSPYLKSKLKLK